MKVWAQIKIEKSNIQFLNPLISNIYLTSFSEFDYRSINIQSWVDHCDSMGDLQGIIIDDVTVGNLHVWREQVDHVLLWIIAF